MIALDEVRSEVNVTEGVCCSSAWYNFCKTSGAEHWYHSNSLIS